MSTLNAPGCCHETFIDISEDLDNWLVSHRTFGDPELMKREELRHMLRCLCIKHREFVVCPDEDWLEKAKAVEGLDGEDED